jgi:predicted unusual protein kinase regulating ubiquinone biosynthesis (AarF/ABC1/UbiB family)/ribosomal protein L7/L12
MDHNTREQRRREMVVRLSVSPADIATSLLARVPSMAATSMRGGLLALLMKLRQSATTDVERESVRRIVTSLGKLKGAAMKLGQHMSYFDPAVPEDVRAELAALQTHSPPMPVSRVTKILRAELGDRAAAIIDTLEPAPLAAASIGQVHRARLPDGTRVAVKVQYPGIAHAIRADFGPAALAGRVASWLYPTSQLRGYLREAKARALDECDYRAEARHQADLAARYADHDRIVVPAVHTAYCGERVLVTTLAEGTHLDEWLASEPAQDRREAIGEALVGFYVGSALRWGLLPGDPHPGNYLIGADGRLAIVDHGCTRALPAARARGVLEAEERSTAERAALEAGADALLLLRVRFGLAAVLARIGVLTSWRELVRKATAPFATRFDVVLVAPGDRMIEIVREVRDLLGANIRDAKELLEQTPRVLRTTSDRKEAEALKRRLETSGGIVEIRAS